ncbi:hypothetical protein AGMMS50262_01500 [Bacteroidia bacterium]|nr:hypothetical protein AGMMS50262_01500 [Bacteroidia bacterium]
MKNIGFILILLGTSGLVIPFFTGLQTNGTLLASWLLIIAGFIAYIIINKKIR